MCCIAPSISAPIPGMPKGKIAGEVCFNLDPDTYLCRLWGGEDYPEFCAAFDAAEEFCGQTQNEALKILTFLEHETHPSRTS
jgi:hypothetical protein